MIKNFRTILAVLVLGGMCFAQAPSNHDQAVQHLENQIKALQSEVDALKTANQNTTQSLQQTQKDFKKTLDEHLSGFARGNVKFGATFFGDWAMYPNGGYAPAFLDNASSIPGPTTTNFNAFEIRRAYLNIFYTPNKHITLRVTPDLGTDSKGNKYFRLKYGYAEIKHIFPHDSFLGKSSLRLGQTQMPLIDFEEGLMAHRYVYKTPWDYMGISSTFVGAAMKGPISFHGKQYLDYQLGIFNIAGYHGIEKNVEKAAMGRLTFYPMGTKKGHGLGISIFDGYGYSGASTAAGAAKALNFGATMLHYVSNNGKYRGIFEYDFGRGGVLSTGHSFGSGLNTAYSTVIANNFGGDPNPWMQSFDVMGSAGLGNTPFSLFGMWQYVQPDTNVSSNPLNYERVVGGVQYKVNKQFRLALTSENYIHANGSDLATAVSNAGGSAADVSNATQDLNGVMLNMEYNY